MIEQGVVRSPWFTIGAMAERSGTSDEDELVRAAQTGDRDAFGLLVKRHQRAIYRLCHRFVKDPQDASDLAQEAFLKAYRGIGRFRGDSGFSTWLYRITVNTCLNFRASRRPAGEALSDSLPAGRVELNERIDAGRLQRRVRAAVEMLPEKQRATLILKTYQELTHQEVAAILGSTVGTVKANLFHALRNLRRIIEERAPEARR
jgi:RNA polymerase sigma-70 factor (ECF subfamily)